MIRCTQFRTMWNVTPSEGVTISPETLTEPGQICLTVREILTRFGALPQVDKVFSGQFDNEEDALAALDFNVYDKEEATTRMSELAEKMREVASDESADVGPSEESPIPSSPQVGQKEEPAPPVGPASQDKASALAGS